MMQHLPIWYLGQLPEAVIDAAAAEFIALPTRDASMDPQGETLNHENRDTTVRFADPDHWFGGLLYQFGCKANAECGWNYDLTGHEAVQYGEYGPQQHYDWHTDTFVLAQLPRERKVSVSVFMNDPEEFSGGEFQLRLYRDYSPVVKKGSMLAFPSLLQHRVTPVISGTRFSSVMWLHGPRLR
ncbi:MAG: 2OG-Fe(II) oxygenase [Burkholderiaceae bacterium]